MVIKLPLIYFLFLYNVVIKKRSRRKVLVQWCHWCAWVLSCFSHVWLFAAPTAARQTPLSMGFYRQEYWSGLPCPIPGGLPNPWITPMSLLSPALAGRSFFFFFPINYSEVYTSVALTIAQSSPLSISRKFPSSPNKPVCPLSSNSPFSTPSRSWSAPFYFLL